MSASGVNIPRLSCQVLLQVAGQCGGIEPLFEVLFSWLSRKTDYFHIMQPGEKMGFA